VYINRTIEATIAKASNSFPAEPSRIYITLDDFNERSLAQNDPELFFKRNPPPILIDEIQYAPELLSYIKIICDQQRKNGLFWITGSQKFRLMQNISESLAGRVAILDLLGLSQAEIFNQANNSLAFLPTEQWLNNARSHAIKEFGLMELYKRIWIGSFPQIVIDPNTNRDLFYASYVQTYIQRDVREITNINNETGFYNFLRAVAARTGQLINYADLARDADINHRTVKDILETSGLIYLLRPYYNNVVNRLIKTPKVYFLDTGLCSYLTRWQSVESLEAGAMSGNILETYIFSEILKSYWHNGKEAYFNFYRDKDGKEIDLIIEQDNILHPIEIKKTANPATNTAANFKLLSNLQRNIGHGMVICLTAKDHPLSRDIDAIPVGYL
jgi:predicted AAA+ superfamily ATPase